MVGHEPQHPCVHFLPKTKLREHYDKNGNPTYSSGPYPASGYAFDPENRLTSAVCEVVPV